MKVNRFSLGKGFRENLLFYGGILSSVALNLKSKLSSYEEVYATYKSIIIISDKIVKHGAIGTILVGIIYGVFTNWGFFKHRWVAVKWFLFIIQTIIGIFIVDKLMIANMIILKSEGSQALNDAVFLHNHFLIQYTVFAQIFLTTLILIISVLKPWRKKVINS